MERQAIPEPHQKAAVEACHKLGIITAAYYVFGSLTDDWRTIAATPAPPTPGSTRVRESSERRISSCHPM